MRRRWITRGVSLLIAPHVIARGAAAWPLGVAWGVHVLGVVIALGGGSALGLLWLRYEDPGAHDRILEAVTSIETAVVVLAGLAIFEAAMVVAAAWCAAWGAGDESASASVSAALKRMFALTPHAAAVWVAGLTAYAVLDGRAWFRPDIEGALDAAAWLSVAMYLVWTTLIVLGAGRSAPRCAWPPRCEACGYTLIGLARDAACPECGESAARSLDASTRPGLWRRGGPDGKAGRGLVTSWLGSFVHCVAAGRRVRLFDAERRITHRFAWSLAAIVASTVGFGLAMEMYHETRYRSGPAMSDFVEVGLAAFAFGLAIAGLAMAVMVGTASLSGWAAGRGAKRNLMPASIQLAAKMSPAFAAAYALFLLYFGMVVIADPDDLFRALSRTLGVDLAVAAMGVIFGPAVVFLLLWTAQLAKATRAARHANL